MNNIKTLNYIFSLMLVLCSGVASAGPTMNTIYVQGYLRKATGSAVSDGNYSMTFAIRSGATYFWTKTVSVAVSGGFFSQGLSGASSAPYGGNIDSASLAAAAAGSLAVNVQTTVDGNAVSFDVQASPVPLALLADKANTVVAGGVDTAAIASSAVTAAKMAASDTMPAWDGSALTNITASNISGTIPSGSFPATLPASSGANLTSLNASALTSGTVPDARFPATMPAASGANLTSLNATQLTSGTIPDARFPATLPVASGANLTSLNAANISGTLPALDGSSLTNLNASNLASGTVPVARIPTTLSNATTFSAAGTALAVTNNATVGGTLGVTGNTTLGGTLTLPNAGTITSAGTTATAVNITATGAGGGITIAPVAAGTGAIQIGSTSSGNVTLGNTGGASTTTITSGTGGVTIGSGGKAITTGIVTCSVAATATATQTVTGCTGIAAGGAGWGCNCNINTVHATLGPAPTTNAVNAIKPGFSALATTAASNIFVQLTAAITTANSATINCMCFK
ncbi:hypothetical protein [Bdellovibrio svalbardensis]|uniref:Cell wall surface anchor family protein n=1 Tax=Bdellovibrio svalbardensis TaxID=2972972 RepID=A0ABT6DKV4_9BACT|nr:hypothetical protein [Bdellovibrio svalbardensis]MDG0817485.1 hypothetical protein [Bdellovibrio svalbardensis]